MANRALLLEFTPPRRPEITAEQPIAFANDCLQAFRSQSGDFHSTVFRPPCWRAARARRSCCCMAPEPTLLTG